mgnify:CR=1 FL=1
MLVTLLAVGRLRPYYREACDDYLRRLRRHVRLTECEVKEAARASGPAAQRAAEGARLAARRPDGSTLVCLARDGQGWTSEALASTPASHSACSLASMATKALPSTLAT